MSDAYKELKNDLVKIAALKDEVIKTDSNSNLTEDEKYAKLAEIALTLCVHNME